MNTNRYEIAVVVAFLVVASLPGMACCGRCAKKPAETAAGAQTKADALLSDARQRSEAILADSQTRSETQVRQAQERADALQADAERKHSEIMGTINQQRTVLEGRIEQLKTFEREYRTRLKSYLESQLEELQQRGSAAPVESGYPAEQQNAGGYSAGYTG